MAKPTPDQDLVPSILDRLIDLEPRSSRESQTQRITRIRDLKRSVRRDLEWLLNTRQILVDVPRSMSHLRDSVLTYGLPDFTHVNLAAPGDRERLLNTIEQALARFEPRLSHVQVTLQEAREFERSIHFRIDAELLVDPEPEPITFDSALELPTKAFTVGEE